MLRVEYRKQWRGYNAERARLPDRKLPERQPMADVTFTSFIHLAADLWSRSSYI